MLLMLSKPYNSTHHKLSILILPVILILLASKYNYPNS